MLNKRMKTTERKFGAVLSHAEVAKLLGMSRQSVAATERRALRKLREAMMISKRVA